jgi:hypothetical protein
MNDLASIQNVTYDVNEKLILNFLNELSSDSYFTRSMSSSSSTLAPFIIIIALFLMFTILGGKLQLFSNCYGFINTHQSFNNSY